MVNKGKQGEQKKKQRLRRGLNTWLYQEKNRWKTREKKEATLEVRLEHLALIFQGSIRGSDPLIRPILKSSCFFSRIREKCVSTRRSLRTCPQKNTRDSQCKPHTSWDSARSAERISTHKHHSESAHTSNYAVTTAAVHTTPGSRGYSGHPATPLGLIASHLLAGIRFQIFFVVVVVVVYDTMSVGSWALFEDELSRIQQDTQQAAASSTEVRVRSTSCWYSAAG